MIKEILLAVIAILGPIISGVWSYKSAVKKSESDLETVKEKNKAEIEAINIQTDNELAKIREQALAEARLHEEKTKTDLVAKQFDNPLVQGAIGNVLGSAMEKVIEKEMAKHFDDNQ